MKILLTLAACATLGVVVTHDAAGQGPIRQGLRRTGEIAAQGTRRVVQGTGQVAAGAVRGAGRVVGGVAGATAQGVRTGVRALTPGLPIQARADANLSAADQARDARWRFQQHSGEWWYYTPKNAWMYHRDGQWNAFAQDSFAPNPAINNQQLAGQQYAGEHTAGFRGAEQQGDQMRQPQAAGQQVRVDRHGRHYICENGRPVYLEQSQERSSGYRGEEMQSEGQLSPTPAQPTDPSQPQLDQHGAIGQEQSALAPATSQDPSATTPNGQSVASESDTSAPESPREINNSPDPANDGDGGTQR